MNQTISRAPTSAFLVGFGGVAVFIGLTTAMFVFALGFGGAPESLDNARLSLNLLILWAGLILAFLGGTRWGRALGADIMSPGPITLLSAAFPSLIAWISVAVSLPPLNIPVLGVSLLVGGFFHMLIWDLQGVNQGLWPNWYSALRVVLTLLAALTLVAAGIGAIMYGIA